MLLTTMDAVDFYFDPVQERPREGQIRLPFSLDKRRVESLVDRMVTAMLRKSSPRPIVILKICKKCTDKYYRSHLIRRVK